MSPAEDVSLTPPGDVADRVAAPVAPDAGCAEASVLLVALASLPAPPARGGGGEGEGYGQRSVDRAICHSVRYPAAHNVMKRNRRSR